MSSHGNPSEVAKKRINKWIMETQPVDIKQTWTERRLAIDFGGHTFIVTNGQIYQCVHCGVFDPEWNATEILTFFKDNFGIKPRGIDIVCSVAVVQDGE